MLSQTQWKREPFLLLVAGLLLSLSLGMLLGAALRQELEEASAAVQNFAAFVVSSLCFHGAVLVLAHYYLRLHGTGWRAFLGLGAERVRKHALLGLGVGVLVVPALLALNKLSYLVLKAIQVEPIQQMTVQLAQDAGGALRRACFGVAAIVLAPVAEEVLFRGIVYPFVRQRGHPLIALIGTSVLFAAIHANMLTFLPLFVFALVLVWLVERTGGLVAPIVTHAFFNAANFVIVVNEPWFNQLINQLLSQVRERI